MDNSLFPFIAFLPFLHITGTLTLMGLGIYLMLTGIKFMKEKNKHDKELIEKIDKLYQLLKEKDMLR